MRALFHSALYKEIPISEKLPYQYYMLVLSKGESFYINVFHNNKLKSTHLAMLLEKKNRYLWVKPLHTILYVCPA